MKGLQKLNFNTTVSKVLLFFGLITALGLLTILLIPAGSSSLRSLAFIPLAIPMILYFVLGMVLIGEEDDISEYVFEGAEALHIALVIIFTVIIYFGISVIITKKIEK